MSPREGVTSRSTRRPGEDDEDSDDVPEWTVDVAPAAGHVYRELSESGHMTLSFENADEIARHAADQIMGAIADFNRRNPEETGEPLKPLNEETYDSLVSACMAYIVGKYNVVP